MYGKGFYGGNGIVGAQVCWQKMITERCSNDFTFLPNSKPVCTVTYSSDYNSFHSVCMSE